MTLSPFSFHSSASWKRKTFPNISRDWQSKISFWGATEIDTFICLPWKTYKNFFPVGWTTWKGSSQKKRGEREEFYKAAVNIRWLKTAPAQNALKNKRGNFCQFLLFALWATSSYSEMIERRATLIISPHTFTLRVCDSDDDDDGALFSSVRRLIINIEVLIAFFCGWTDSSGWRGPSFFSVRSVRRPLSVPWETYRGHVRRRPSFFVCIFLSPSISG